MKRGITLVPMLALPLVVTSCGNLADDASSSASFAAHNAGTNGQGAPAGQAFNALSASQKSDLIAYLNTL